MVFLCFCDRICAPEQDVRERNLSFMEMHYICGLQTEIHSGRALTLVAFASHYIDFFSYLHKVKLPLPPQEIAPEFWIESLLFINWRSVTIFVAESHLCMNKSLKTEFSKVAGNLTTQLNQEKLNVPILWGALEKPVAKCSRLMKI